MKQSFIYAKNPMKQQGYALDFSDVTKSIIEGKSPFRPKAEWGFYYA